MKPSILLLALLTIGITPLLCQAEEVIGEVIPKGRYYEVYNKEQLSWAMQQLTAADAGDKVVVLMNDIDYDDVAWLSVGTSTTPFRGTLDGNGKRLSNVYLYNSAGLNDNGLIGYADGAVVKNLRFHAKFRAGNDNDNVAVGMLIGYAKNNVKVRNCEVEATLLNCGELLTTAGFGWIIGATTSNATGIVVSDCHAVANITSLNFHLSI